MGHYLSEIEDDRQVEVNNYRKDQVNKARAGINTALDNGQLCDILMDIIEDHSFPHVTYSKIIRKYGWTGDE